MKCKVNLVKFIKFNINLSLGKYICPLATVCSRGYNLFMGIDNSSQKYQEALDYIYSFVDYSRTHQQNLAPENFNLARVRDLMTLLGNPERAYTTIHVAGSKGKGSVCAFCASALEVQGYKVGLYTSPHMEKFNERIQINGRQIEDDELVALVEEIKPHVAKIPRITTFEIVTALGFLYFQQKRIDIGVIEVGLGGRLDATNVIMPKVSVITQLYLEHTFILGNTLTEIAEEKGGIIKPNIPVVISTQKDEAEKKLLKIASMHHSPVHQIGKDYIYQIDGYNLNRQSFSIINNKKKSKRIDLTIPLLGDFQVENAATAFAALDVLRDSDVEITDNAIKKGFKDAVWPGRFEILQASPPIIVDSAHNKDAIINLIKTVRKYFPSKSIVMVFGVSADKDVIGMLSELEPYVQQVICSQSTHPRAMDSDQLCEVARKLWDNAIAVKDVEHAFKTAINMAKGERLVLVTGSIFVVAGAREWWRKQKTSSV